jgi:hypothetical protein
MLSIKAIDCLKLLFFINIEINEILLTRLSFFYCEILLKNAKIYTQQFRLTENACKSCVHVRRMYNMYILCILHGNMTSCILHVIKYGTGYFISAIIITVICDNGVKVVIRSERLITPVVTLYLLRTV